MKKLPGILLLHLFIQANSQYYYKDIVAAADLTRQMKIYNANNIKKVTAVGITPEGSISKDFNETQEIDAQGTMLKYTTRINETVSSVQHQFNTQRQLLMSKDSSAGVISTSTYGYDDKGRIISISNTTSDKDTTGSLSQKEIHQYVYNDNSLTSMWRIIGKDSLEVKFKADDNGNIIEERNYRKGKGSDPIYYYYDDRNRLTDIVRYNYKAKRLLPDFLFEYDGQDRVIQKITTTSNQNMGYLTWRYLYNDKGLKTKEALFNKEKKLQGRIDYTYN